MHVRRALALAAVGPLLLAGCTGDPEPSIPDPTTSSPTPTTPTPTDSETPEAESAEEFIRRWSDVVREMQATGDTKEYRRISPKCAPCRETAERVESIYEQGGTIEWAGWRILDIAPYGNSDVEFRVEMRAAPTRYRETAEGPWQRIDGGAVTRLLEVAPSGSSWLMVNTAELAG